MKRQPLFALTILLLGRSCFGQASPNRGSQETPQSDPGYSITVSPTSEPIHLGSPINVIITVTVGDKEIYWRAERIDGPYTNFGYLLTKDNHEVETTFFHRRITGRNRPDDPPEAEDGSSIVAPVAPGKSFTFRVDVTKLYQITEAGLYMLEVRRFDESSKVTVRAKPLTLNIVP